MRVPPIYIRSIDSSVARETPPIIAASVRYCIIHRKHNRRREEYIQESKRRRQRDDCKRDLQRGQKLYERDRYHIIDTNASERMY